MLRVLVPGMRGDATAIADGLFAPQASWVGTTRGNNVVSGRQQAVLVLDNDKVQVVLQTQFEPGPKELAWIIPVPSKPETVKEGDEHMFESLEVLTAPRFVRLITGGGGLGCASRTATESVGRLVVYETGKAGIFDYTVLGGGAVEELVQWLGKHQYRLPANADAVLKHYVDASWYFLAIQVNAKEQDHATLAPRPICYTYRADNVTYPLMISRLSAGAQNEVVLYVLASKRYGAKNWENRTVPCSRLFLDEHSHSGTNYEKLFQEELNQGDRHVLVTEAAFRINYRDEGPFNPVEMYYDWELDCKLPPDEKSGYLTRMRTIIPPDGMDRDVFLEPSPEPGNDVQALLHVHQPVGRAPRAETFAACAVVGALFLLLWVRSRRRDITHSGNLERTK